MSPRSSMVTSWLVEWFMNVASILVPTATRQLSAKGDARRGNSGWDMRHDSHDTRLVTRKISVPASSSPTYVRCIESSFDLRLNRTLPFTSVMTDGYQPPRERRST
jgi:hypothetical protein